MKPAMDLGWAWTSEQEWAHYSGLVWAWRTLRLHATKHPQEPCETVRGLGARMYRHR